MKKWLLFLLGGLVACNVAQAQISKGGIPASYGLHDEAFPERLHTYKPPSYQQAVGAWQQQEEKDGHAKPYLVAIGTDIDFSFPGSGYFSELGDGSHIWRAVIDINGAKGLSMYYDNFQLPDGVRYFISNENARQLLGAYTNANNRSSGLFAHEAIQGDRIHIEMDIDAGVNIGDIKLHADKAAFYFRGVDDLAAFGNDEETPMLLSLYDTLFYNYTSVCMINAVCPLGKNYFNQKRASLSIVIPDEDNTSFAMCSAVMINTADNAVSGCKNYLMTASHCDYSNSSEKNRWDQALFRFNYEEPDCTNGNTAPEAKTLTGASFIARSDFDTVNFLITGDFLLLRLKDAIPESWNITLAGWNRDTGVTRQETQPRKFISFNHPYADVKKISSGHIISPAPFSTGVTELTHWHMNLDSGYVGSGSSGAGLFDGDGYLIGTLTGSKTQVQISACNINSKGDEIEGGIPLHKDGYFSMISYNWSNNVMLNRKLQPWLDPGNSNILKIKGAKASCTPMDTVNTLSIAEPGLNGFMTVFPNPVSGTTVNIKFNLKQASDIRMQLYDINGRALKAFNVSGVTLNSYNIDVSNLPDGVYLLKITDGKTGSNKRIVIRH